MGCWLRRSFRNTQIEQHLFPPGVHPFTSVLDRKSITLEFCYTGISFFTQLQEQVTSLKLLCAEPWVWSVAVIPQPLIFPFPQSLHDHISASSGSHGCTLLGWAGLGHLRSLLKLPQLGEVFSQLCPLEESPTLWSALVKTILCLAVPLEGEFTSIPLSPV